MFVRAASRAARQLAQRSSASVGAFPRVIVPFVWAIVFLVLVPFDCVFGSCYHALSLEVLWVRGDGFLFSVSSLSLSLGSYVAWVGGGFVSSASRCPWGASLGG